MVLVPAVEDMHGIPRTDEDLFQVIGSMGEYVQLHGIASLFEVRSTLDGNIPHGAIFQVVLVFIDGGEPIKFLLRRPLDRILLEIHMGIAQQVRKGSLCVHIVASLVVGIVAVIRCNLISHRLGAGSPGTVINSDVSRLGGDFRVNFSEIAAATVYSYFLRRRTEYDSACIVNQVLDELDLHIVIAEIRLDRFRRLERDVAPIAIAAQVGKDFQNGRILDVVHRG